MRIKRFFSIFTALILCFSLAVPALAVEIQAVITDDAADTTETSISENAISEQTDTGNGQIYVIDESAVPTETYWHTEDQTTELSPAYHHEEIIDGVQITIDAPEGVLPDSCGVEILPAYVDDAVLSDLIPDPLDGEISQYTCNITFYGPEGNEVQPDTEYGTVSVVFKGIEIPDDAEVSVVHLSDDLSEIEEVLTPDQVFVDSIAQEVLVEAEHFSTYSVFIWKYNIENEATGGDFKETRVFNEVGERIYLKDLPDSGGFTLAYGSAFNYYLSLLTIDNYNLDEYNYLTLNYDSFSWKGEYLDDNDRYTLYLNRSDDSYIEFKTPYMLSLEFYANSDATSAAYFGTHRYVFIINDNTSGHDYQLGDDVYADYDSETATLTISGSGDMWPYPLKVEDAYNTTISNFPGQGRFYDEYFGSLSITNLVVEGSVEFGKHLGELCSACSILNVDLSDDLITAIPAKAFYAYFYDQSEYRPYSLLESIILPPTLTSIGSFAFYGCDHLTSITIPASVKTIERYAFYKCDNLTEISGGNGVETVGDKAFIVSSTLDTTLISNSSALRNYDWTGSKRNVTIEDAGEALSWNLGNSSGVYAQIDAAYTDMDDNITASLSFHNGTDETDGYDMAFTGSGKMGGFLSPEFAPYHEYRQNIVSVTISEGITNIGERVLEGVAIVNLSLPESVVTLNSYCVTGAESLTMVDLSNVTTLAAYVFADCTALSSVVLSEALTLIPFASFQNTALTSLDIPESVTGIGLYAFKDCESLTTITGGEGIEVDYMPEPGSESGAFYVSDNINTLLLTDSEALKGYGWTDDNRTKVLSYSYVLTAPASIEAKYDIATREFSFDVTFTLAYTLNHSGSAHGVSVTPAASCELINGDDRCIMTHDSDGAVLSLNSLAGDSAGTVTDSQTYTYTSGMHEAVLGTYNGELSFTIASS